VLVEQLWRVGVRDIFADGSFVEDEYHPNDIDGYFVCELRRLARGQLQRELNLLDPHYGQPSGIRDTFGHELEFPSAFRLSRRDGKPRGIIKIGGPS
jgi:hypothetical protein